MPTERVLVVDDDPAILTLCHRILEADGYAVVDAKRGEDALARLEGENFDLLLTDIRLPGVTGLDVTQRLRERNSELTVVTMTGYSNMEMAIQALSLGVDEFIIKPFTPDSLRFHVSRALEKSRLRRENMRLRTLLPLLQTAQSFAGGRTRDQVYQELFDAAATIFKTGEMFFLSATRDEDLFTVAAFRGEKFARLLNETAKISEWHELSTFFSTDAQYWNEQTQNRLPFFLSSCEWMVGAPLHTQEDTLGILFVGVAKPPSSGDLEIIQLISAQAAVALQNVDLLAEISRAYVNVSQVEQIKTEFLNVASHELRTPLAVLRGYASILRDQLQGEPREYVLQVLECAARLQQIADDMLALKYLEPGQVDLRLEECEVAQVVSQVVNSYRPLASEREQSIELAIEQASGRVIADRAMLDMMLGSLISNAIKFSPRKSQVVVAASGDDGHVTLRVQDQGKGLTPEQQAHVFDSFYQASHSLTRQEGGLGLGLTLTRKMVDAHGGKIWVESEYNHGSSFYISLPREITTQPN